MTRLRHHAAFASSTLVIAMLSAPAQGKILINEVDLASNKIELVNTGGASEDLTSWWFCNRVNGSPFYSPVSNYAIDAGLSTPGATLASFGAGQTLVLDLTAGLLPDANGEMGLYNTNSFGSASAIEDYVLWGANGIRDIVAENAGIWTDNDSIDVSGIGAGETLQVLPGTEGDASTEWTLGAGTLGSANVPEPATAGVMGLGLMALLRRRR